MISILLCISIIFLFVFDSNTVIDGATYGLMLWYKNVLPMLLPFMLISGVMVNNLNGAFKSTTPKNASIFTTIFLGIFCGYPLGAKTTADFYTKGNYSVYTAEYLLPLCNNASPMFISGYIFNSILLQKYSLFMIFLLIYLPYIIATILFFVIHNFIYNPILNKKTYSKIAKQEKITYNVSSHNNDILLNSINQITYVAVYIMICSIALEFILKMNFLSDDNMALISGITEITRGTMQISNCSMFDEDKKTALILAATSFGGISSILQTKKVISNSKLSIIFYIVIKMLCATFTYRLSILLI